MKLNIKQLKHICSLTQKEVKKYCINALKSFGYTVQVGDGYVYAEGKYPVMLVAHMDTVHDVHSDHDKPAFTIVKANDTNLPVAKQQQVQVVDAKGLLSSPQGIGGDDRCGIYIILEILKTYSCSVLFCEDEEIGGIGAKKFTKSGIVPDVNYFMEFDRRGTTDAVFYSCGTKSFIDFVTTEKLWTKSYGSYSDISTLMPHFGVAGVNLSSGYEGAHTKLEVINTLALPDIIMRAKQILEKESGKFKYEEAAYGGYAGYGNYSGYGNYGGSYTRKKQNYGSESYDDYDEYYGYGDLTERHYGYTGRKKQENYSWRETALNVGYLPTFSDLSADTEETTPIKFEIKYFDQVNQMVRVRGYWAKNAFAAIGRLFCCEKDVRFNDILDIVPYPQPVIKDTKTQKSQKTEQSIEKEVQQIVDKEMEQNKKGDEIK